MNRVEIDDTHHRNEREPPLTGTLEHNHRTIGASALMPVDRKAASQAAEVCPYAVTMFLYISATAAGLTQLSH